MSRNIGRKYNVNSGYQLKMELQIIFFSFYLSMFSKLSLLDMHHYWNTKVV